MDYLYLIYTLISLFSESGAIYKKTVRPLHKEVLNIFYSKSHIPTKF